MLSMSGAREKMIAAGMNDCIHKPIEMDKICNVIRNHLKDYQNLRKLIPLVKNPVSASQPPRVQMAS